MTQLLFYGPNVLCKKTCNVHTLLPKLCRTEERREQLYCRVTLLSFKDTLLSAVGEKIVLVAMAGSQWRWKNH